jgi:hypothetical protein
MRRAHLRLPCFAPLDGVRGLAPQPRWGSPCFRIAGPLGCLVHVTFYEYETDATMSLE